jgi:hypothetical protein
MSRFVLFALALSLSMVASSKINQDEYDSLMNIYTDLSMNF